MVTVNVVVVVRADPASVAWRVCAPALDAGTVNLQTNAPEVVVVIVVLLALRAPDEQLTNASELPANVTVTVPDSVKPEPVRMTEPPTGPWLGFATMVGTVTRKGVATI
jgi:hypothetical protein